MNQSQATANVTNVTNGVDVDRLAETIGAIGTQPDLAQFRFRASNKWLGGSLNESRIEPFDGAGQTQVERKGEMVYRNDEPEVLLGEDRSANPAEFLLHALAGCLTTTMTYHAAARGIELECLESELEGDVDLHGLLGLSEDVRPGFSEIRVNFKTKSDAPAELLRELAEYSVVFDTIRNPVSVKVNIEKV